MADEWAIVNEHAATLPRLELNLDPLSAWALIATMQVALRNPYFAGKTAANIRRMLAGLITGFANGDPGVDVILSRVSNDASREILLPCKTLFEAAAADQHPPTDLVKPTK